MAKLSLPLRLLAGTLLLTARLFGQAPATDAKLVEKENIVETSRPATPKWSAAQLGMSLVVKDKVRTGEESRAAVQLSDLTVLRMDELTTLQVEPPRPGAKTGTLDVESGGVYFFSRERSAEVQVRTPAATGALRGTQLVVRVSPLGKTLLTMLEGEVELSNAQGSVTLRSGEQGEAEIGKAPRKTAVILARNILQWALYYPGVLDLNEIGIDKEAGPIAASLTAYRDGDLLQALEKYPRGRTPSTVPGKLYRAGVLLAVGRVDEAGVVLKGVPASHPQRRALEKVISAVNFEEYPSGGEFTTAGEWLAESYYLQSRSNLEGARAAARRATEAAPAFGYAWVHLAELEFSFGRVPASLKALDRGLELTPRNAQAHALRGFLLSAQNRIDRARLAFSAAIQIDGALGNAWLGRGLTYIRQGQDEEGRRELQIAATLEPNRSVLHSYLGKAFSQVGDKGRAHLDLKRAKELDPNDPTPWLYSAIENRQENRYNEAVRDLEKSLELNDNRRVYRSRFLLDQDRGIRSSNLAAIYQNDGMDEVAVREATRAVNSDYGSAPAHLFLANAFNALRDPRRILLRFETPWFNELLISNLLSPVGSGPLSQFISQGEYSKLFESDRLGLSTVTDAYSYGELRETASQFGTYRNFSYALDYEYLYNDGIRPNNDISRTETYAQFKFQLGPQDTLFFQTKYEDLRQGDIFSRFDPGEVDRAILLRDSFGQPLLDANGKRIYQRNTSALTTRFHEIQEPALLLLGYHHEWSPGNHTLLLLGRLHNDQTASAFGTNQALIFRDATGLVPPAVSQTGAFADDRILQNAVRGLPGKGQILGVGGNPFNLDYRASFEIYSAELNQIITAGPLTAVLGARFQHGVFSTQNFLTLDDPANNFSFLNPPSNDSFDRDFERISAYMYDYWRVTPWLTLLGGIAYDKLRYPDNYRNVPINDDETSFGQFSPKAGFILNPIPSMTIRGAYTKSISGASFDESIRLEPTQFAGFTQASRTFISEDVIGSIAGARYNTYGLSVEQKLKSGTYLGAEFSIVEQDLDRDIGAFDFFQSQQLFAALPSTIGQKLSYREDNLTATINQIVGDNLAFGARYRYSRAHFRTQTDLPEQFVPVSEQHSTLHQVNLFALYNHPSGFFAKAEANWFHQDNNGFTAGQFQERPQNDPRPGDDFWQLNIYAGYRFFRNQCELSVGLLNLGGSDYQLEPLNYYLELPRERTFFARLKITF